MSRAEKASTPDLGSLDDLSEVMLTEVGGQDVVDAVDALYKIIEGKDPDTQIVAKAYTRTYLGLERPVTNDESNK